MSEYSYIGLADKWRPRVPKGDDAESATAVVNAVLECTLAWSDQLSAIANEYFDAAPESSAHVGEFDAAIARAFFEWLEEWPR